MNVNEILSRTPPDLLYHYTNQKGLLEIIGSKEIWATHTQYLNDQREFKHAISMVEQELSTLRDVTVDRDKRRLLDEMEKGLKGVESINVCVCSFSERGDILSQWRACGGAASGFSVGFSGFFSSLIIGSSAVSGIGSGFNTVPQ